MVRLRSPAPSTSVLMGEFPSGQRGQTVNLLSLTSVVRIHLPPPEKDLMHSIRSFSILSCTLHCSNSLSAREVCFAGRALADVSVTLNFIFCVITKLHTTNSFVLHRKLYSHTCFCRSFLFVAQATIFYRQPHHHRCISSVSRSCIGSRYPPASKPIAPKV